jgi:6-phosphofructokinase 1
MEVMGREAGWIALHSAVAGGAEVCLIPEIPYDIEKVKKRISKRIINGRGFVNIVIAEGAFPKEENYQKHTHGAGIQLMNLLKDSGVETDIRVTILGHLQRGGIPIAFDRILATQFGVKAFEMVLKKDFGKMVALRDKKIIAVPIDETIEKYNLVNVNSDLVKTARSIGICFGD